MRSASPSTCPATTSARRAGPTCCSIEDGLPPGPSAASGSPAAFTGRATRRAWGVFDTTDHVGAFGAKRKP